MSTAPYRFLEVELHPAQRSAARRRPGLPAPARAPSTCCWSCSSAATGWSPRASCSIWSGRTWWSRRTTCRCTSAACASCSAPRPSPPCPGAATASWRRCTTRSPPSSSRPPRARAPKRTRGGRPAEDQPAGAPAGAARAQRRDGVARRAARIASARHRGGRGRHRQEPACPGSGRRRGRALARRRVVDRARRPRR
mgnify:CR=1 FL=1